MCSIQKVINIYMEFDDVYRKYKQSQKNELKKTAGSLTEALTSEYESFVLENKETLRRISLGFGIDELDPVVSEEALSLHYNVLYKNYVAKYNTEGDSFQEAGAFLHQKFFENLAAVHDGKCTNIQVKAFISRHFQSFSKFTQEFKSAALAIQGNGWVALTRSGNIVTISNHKKINNIVLLLDMWEHAWLLDYGSDKAKWVDKFWKIVDWDIVGARL